MNYMARKKTTLGVKVFIYVFIISVIFSVLMSTIQKKIHRSDKLEHLMSEVNSISNLQADSIANSVYVVNDEMLSIQLSGLESLPAIGGIQVVESSKYGARTIFKGSDKGFGEISPIELIHDEKHINSRVSIGVMRVFLDLDHFNKKEREEYKIILIANFVRTFIIALSILIIVQLMITRHLINMASFTSEIDIDNTDPLKLNRKTHESPDELDLVVESINYMKKTLHDNIIELRDKNKTLINTQKKLVQTEKVSALGILVSGIAHEVNNPTNYVKNSISNFEKESDKLKNILENVMDLSTDEGAQFWELLEGKFLKISGQIRIMKNGVNRIENIVKGLSAISRSGSLEKEEVDIVPVIASILDSVESQYKNIRFKLSGVDEQVLSVFAEPFKMAMLNFLINACQATTNFRLKNDGEINIEIKSLGEYVVISIEDNGGGISEENESKVFDPFFTTRPQGEGVGLGLAICSNIIDEHNGTITLNSFEGIGSIFQIELPLK